MTTHPSWLSGMICKRTPDAVSIMADLLNAGLARGEVSALDVVDRNYAQPNVIGGAIRTLPRMGFIHTDRRVKTAVVKKHARRVDVWELSDRSKAEAALTEIRKHLFGIESNGQRRLAL